MHEYKYTEEEYQVNKVLLNQNNQLKEISFPNDQLESDILSTKRLLDSIGYGEKIQTISKNKREQKEVKTIYVPSWKEICQEANDNITGKCGITSLFSPQELLENEEYINSLNREYNALHKLDEIDITICAFAGIISGIVDILLVGIPGPSTAGVKAGALSNYIRNYFEKKYPPEEMEKLGQKKAYKVSYDAQDNRNTTEYIEGLSSYYHRLLSLGHDPLLGFFVGILDIMTGRMTTIDKSGKIVSQVMENYNDRKETHLFSAIAKQLRHLKSDITTPMGLPVPLMGLFNLFQFGRIGEYEQTVAEIVQGMYYEGYDFIHFCSMSVPVMLTEVIVRLSYCFKRMKEGYSLKDSLPYSLNREKRPKLATMLFLSHSFATLINTGKVYFSKNPMAINYPQWLAFGKYAFQQTKWLLYEKPELRDKYVMNKLFEERNVIMQEIDTDFYGYFSDNQIVFV